VRNHRPLFGTKQNQSNVHRDARKIIAGSFQSQPFENIEDLLDELYWKFLENLYLRGGAEGTQINWCQIGISIQLRGKFKGLLKVNLRNLFDKTTQLNVDNIYARDDCDLFDVLEDSSDPKGFVKLLIYFANMCSANQQRVFCYPATKSKGFTKRMKKQAHLTSRSISRATLATIP
jgi:hypothetical protein